MATYSSYHDFIRTTGAEPPSLIAIMDPLTFASSQTKKAILPQSDVGKTKGEIRGNFNSYCVTIAKRRHHREAR